MGIGSVLSKIGDAAESIGNLAEDVVDVAHDVGGVVGDLQRGDVSGAFRDGAKLLGDAAELVQDGLDLEANMPDLGGMVGDAMDAVLPEKYDWLCEATAAGIDFETGNELGAIQHGLAALGELAGPGVMFIKSDGAVDETSGEKHAINDGYGGGSTAAGPSCGGTQGTCEPTPPTTGPSGGGTSALSPSERNEITGSSSGPLSSASAGSSGTSGSGPASDFFGQSDADLMNQVRNGKLPEGFDKDPKNMLALQERMAHISEMNALMSSLMKMMHDMNMAIIQNLRV